MITGQMRALPKYPKDARHDHRPLQAGDLIALDYKPWRIREIREMPPDLADGRTHLRVRSAAADQTFESHPDDVSISGRAESLRYLYRLQEHYGLCVKCGDLQPCREVETDRAIRKETQRMMRYSTPGICPCCAEVVTHRQKRETFPNVIVPLGPPVTFHAGRRGCARAMERYRDMTTQVDTQLHLDGGQP